MENSYSELMMAKPLVKIDSSFKLNNGQLIGFQAFGKGEITAAYPVWAQKGKEVQFVLYVKDGRPCIDNDWIREDSNCMFTNEEPIIVDMGIKHFPTTFQNEISKFFNG